MKALLILLGIGLVAAGGSYAYFHAHPEVQPSMVVDGVKQRLHEVIDRFKPKPKEPPPPTRRIRGSRTRATPTAVHPPLPDPWGESSAGKTAPAKPSPVRTRVPAAKRSTVLYVDPEKQVTLYLNNGGIVTGELVSDVPSGITLRWDYGDVDFRRAEIRRVVKGKQDTDEDDVAMPWEGKGEAWPYQHDVVVRLMKGSVVDGEITSVTAQEVIVSQVLPSGGQIEHTVQRADIDQLLFKPIRDERSKQLEENLRTIFPTMRVQEEGFFIIITDSTPPNVKDYLRTTRELATDWYLTFFSLAGHRKPTVPVYLVIFDDFESYIEYALTDGIPGWLAPGYFSPNDQALYGFNFLGERFSELLYEVYLGQFRTMRDQVSVQLKGSGYQETVEGILGEFVHKLEAAHARLRQVYWQTSADILRHELTHALFHSWQLQTVVLSQMEPEQGKTEAEQKAKYLKESDIEKKRQLLDGLLAQESQGPPIQARAANAWYIEGLAGYMEPTPLGGANQRRLAEIQKARAEQQIVPMEFLHAFQLGSFRGMTTQSKRYAYAQSWALCHFLMQRYPKPFLEFLERLAGKAPGPDEDTLPWLITSIDKDQRELESEFLAYVDAFPPEDPPWLKQMQDFLDLRAELLALARQHFGVQ